MSNYQCQECGSVQRIKSNKKVNDKLYIDLYCPYCKEKTKQLWVGNKYEDQYYYYNINEDPRYYEYKTKQND